MSLAVGSWMADSLLLQALGKGHLARLNIIGRWFSISYAKLHVFWAAYDRHIARRVVVHV